MSAVSNLVSYTDPISSQMVVESLANLINHTDSRYQNLYLNAGNYSIDYTSSNSPALDVAHPLLLDGSTNAVLTFTGHSDQVGIRTTYNSAIRIRSSHVKLSNFKVRFQNQVLFTGGDKDGAAIKAQGDSGRFDQRIVDVDLVNLDFIGPAPAADDSAKQNDVEIKARGRNAQTSIYFDASGTIDENTIRGGQVFIQGGPVSITDNTYVGTVPTKDTFPANYHKSELRGKTIPSYVEAVFNSYSPFDQVVKGNHAGVTRVDNSPSSNEVLGTAYRFLLYRIDFPGGSGGHNVVDGNFVDPGMGRRLTDDDSGSGDISPLPTTAQPIGNPYNAPEVFLNETYDVLYEGTTLPLSTDRRVLTVPDPDSSRWRTFAMAGDVVAILSGPNAGQYRVIAQVVNKNTFILNEEMPGGASDLTFTVSVDRGLVDTTCSGNTVDLRLTTSTAFVMTGNQFKLALTGNTILGDDTYVIDGNKNVKANTAIDLVAYQNEASSPNSGDGYAVKYPLPSIYWTRNPIFDATVTGNTINGVLGGVKIRAINAGTSSSLNRTYLSADVKGNKFTGYDARTTVGTTPTIESTNLLTIGGYGFTRGNNNNPTDFSVTKYALEYAILDGSRNVIKNTDATLYYKPAADTTTPESSTGGTMFRFADPLQIQVKLAGNWLERVAGATYTKNVFIASAVVNGTNTVYTQPEHLTALATSAPNPSPALIVDNGDDAYATIGTWTSSAVGYQGDIASATAVAVASAPTATATWSFGGLTPGRYRVYATWHQDDNAAKDAPYTVLSGALALATYRMDQRQSLSQVSPDLVDPDQTPWWTLGGFGTLVDVTDRQITILLGNNASAKVLADAVRIERVGALRTVDNGDAGYSTTGTWTTYTTPYGFQGDTGSATAVSVAATPTATATWTFSGLARGRYRVYVGWAEDDNAANNAPFAVKVGTFTLGSYRLDQRQSLRQGPDPNFYDAGLSWYALGGGGNAFDLADSQLQLVVTLGNNASSYVTADAVRIERIGDLRTVDNGDADHVKTGSWTTYAPVPGYRADTDSIAGVGVTAAPTATSTWTFNGLAPGRYRVYATWYGDAASSPDAPYTVTAGSSTLGTYRMNQRSTNSPAPDFYDGGFGWWALGGLGNYLDLTGPQLSIMLGNNGTGNIVADAVRIERVGDLRTVDNGDPGYTSTGTWSPYVGAGYWGDITSAAPVAVTSAPTATSTWTFNGLAPGRYRIYATWHQDNNAASDAPFTVKVGSFVRGTYRMDQRQGPVPSFYDLDSTPWWGLGGSGTLFDLNGTESLTISLGNNASAKVLADAVRIERVGDLRAVDNGNSGYSSTGTWTTYAVGFQGDIASSATAVSVAATPTATATWTFSGLARGRYRVYVGWAEDDNAANNAPFAVKAGTFTLGSYRLDQRQSLRQGPSPSFYDAGLSWYALGGGGNAFDLTGSQLLVILGNNASSYVIADAVRIERVGDLRTVDNGDAAYSSTGTWTTYTNSGYVTDSASATPVATTATSTATSTWTFSGLTPGRYRVYATWVPQSSNRASNAPFTVKSGSQTLGTYRMNQYTTGPGPDFYDGDVGWWALGGLATVFNVTGSDLTIMLGNNADGPVIADAIRIERIGD